MQPQVSHMIRRCATNPRVFEVVDTTTGDVASSGHETYPIAHASLQQLLQAAAAQAPKPNPEDSVWEPHDTPGPSQNLGLGGAPAGALTVLIESPPSMLLSVNPPENLSGTLVTIPAWQDNTEYPTNSCVLQGNFLYECNADHISGASFAADSAFWSPLIASTGAGFASAGVDGTVGGSGGTPVNANVAGASAVLHPSGGDDSAAIAAALTSFAPFASPHIILGPGTFLWNTAAVPIPRNRPARITGAGKDSTFIKLSATAPRAFDFSSQLIQNSTVTANITSGTTSVTITAGSQANFQNGMLISHPAFPYGTTLVSGAGTSTWTTSMPATASPTGATVYVSDLFADISFKGLTVDANNVQSFDSVVLGTKESGTARYYVSARDIYFEDIRTINVPSVITTGDYSQVHRSSVAITCNHHNFGEPTRSILWRIQARRCEFFGGDSGMLIAGGGGQLVQTGTTNQLTGLTATAVAGSGLTVGPYYYRLVALDTNGYPCYPSLEATATATSVNGQINLAWTIPGGSSIGSILIYRGTSSGWYTQSQSVAAAATTFSDTNTGWSAASLNYAINCFLDDILADSCSHFLDPAQAGRTPTQGGVNGAGFQFGSLGFGGRYTIKHCRVVGAADGCYELDACEQSVFEDNHATDYCNVGIYLGSFSWPNAPMKVIISKFRTKLTAGWQTPGTATSAVKYYPTSGILPERVRINGHRHVSLHSSLYSISTFVSVNSADTPLIEFDDCYADAPAISPAQVEQNIGCFVFGANNAGGSSGNVPSKIVMRGVGGRISGQTNGFSVAGTHLISLESGTWTLDWSDIRPEIFINGAANHSIIGIRLMRSPNVISEGVIAGYRPQLGGDSFPWALTFDSTGGAAITRRIRLEDNDWSGVAGNSSAINSVSIIPAVFANGKIYADEGFVPQGTYPRAPYSLTPGASGTATLLAENVPGRIVISGGTGTAVNWGPSSGTTYSIFQQASAGFGGFAFDISPGDYWSVTYSVAPTVVFIPSRK